MILLHEGTVRTMLPNGVKKQKFRDVRAPKALFSF